MVFSYMNAEHIFDELLLVGGLIPSHVYWTHTVQWMLNEGHGNQDMSWK